MSRRKNSDSAFSECYGYRREFLGEKATQYSRTGSEGFERLKVGLTQEIMLGREDWEYLPSKNIDTAKIFKATGAR